MDTWPNLYPTISSPSCAFFMVTTPPMCPSLVPQTSARTHCSLATYLAPTTQPYPTQYTLTTPPSHTNQLCWLDALLLYSKIHHRISGNTALEFFTDATGSQLFQELATPRLYCQTSWVPTQTLCPTKLSIQYPVANLKPHQASDTSSTQCSCSATRQKPGPHLMTLNTHGIAVDTTIINELFIYLATSHSWYSYAHQNCIEAFPISRETGAMAENEQSHGLALLPRSSPSGGLTCLVLSSSHSVHQLSTPTDAIWFPNNVQMKNWYYPQFLDQSGTFLQILWRLHMHGTMPVMGNWHT